MSSPHLTPEERWRIWFLHHDQGLSIPKVSKQINRDTKTIKHWIETYEATGTMDDLPKSGVPRKTTKKEDTYMVSRANRDDWTATDIKRGMNTKGLSVVPERTIERRLKEVGLQNKSTKKKPPLKPEHFKERARIATRLKDRRWDSVLFTDYAKYELGSRKRYAWTKKGERKYRKVKMHPPKFNFWVSFGRAGPGVLHIFDENLTGQMHYNIINTYGLQAAKKLFSGKWC
jgi:transposase